MSIGPQTCIFGTAIFLPGMCCYYGNMFPGGYFGPFCFISASSLYIVSYTLCAVMPGYLNQAKHRSRNRKVLGSIPGVGMSGGGRRQPCVKVIPSLGKSLS